jgi:ribonuclease HI
MIVAAADGSCLGNPGPGGWAWVIENGRVGRGGYRRATNNLMELRAVLELLRATPRGEPLLVQTDSAYVIGVFTEWLPRWRANGMRTAGNKSVVNAEMIELIAAELDGRHVAFEKVPGHAGHSLNERADELAKDAARHAAAIVASSQAAR